MMADPHGLGTADGSQNDPRRDSRGVLGFLVRTTASVKPVKMGPWSEASGAKAQTLNCPFGYRLVNCRFILHLHKPLTRPHYNNLASTPIPTAH